jgi:hypothetical protein
MKLGTLWNPEYVQIYGAITKTALFHSDATKCILDVTG